MRYAVILGYLVIGLSALPFCGPSPQSIPKQRSVVPTPRTTRVPPSVQSASHDASPPPRSGTVSGNLASPAFPAGSQQTRDFLSWANRLWAHYCFVKLDENGNCKHVYVDVCWAVKDTELQVISDLTHVEGLSIYGALLTDDGLRYLARMPHLKRLQLYGADKITAQGWDWLKQENPDLILVPRSKPLVN